MSYTSGINSLQQTIGQIAPSETKPAIQANAFDQGANRSAEQTASPDRVDQTNLSSTGGLVAQALGGSDTRSAKIASLQQAISAGTYSVSSPDVADKIIQSLLD